MDHLDALDVAIGEFRQRLVGVADHQWSDATPCDGWDVRDLVVHVVGGNRFGAMVLAGATADDAMASVINDSQLGTNRSPSSTPRPLPNDRDSVAPEPSPRRATISPAHSPGARFLAMRVFDVAVHSWDLARATAADEQLDVELAQTVLDILTDFAATGGPGFGITPIGQASSSDSPQARVLDLCGPHV